MFCEGNVMMYIEDWFEENKITFTKPMDDIESSKLFASITKAERDDFFKRWIKDRSEREYIAYDITSISTYSENTEMAEWGYNRDNDNLPQVNLGMYYGVTTHMPIYYDLYSGSIPDKVYMEYMMESSKSLGIKDVCFVIDRGFVMEGNLQYLYESGYPFITAMPGDRIDAMKIIDENRDNVRKSANRINEYGIYGYQCPVNTSGIEVQAYIYFDTEKQAYDEKELFMRIERLQSELEKINRAKRVTKKYKEYFVVNDNAKGNLTFEQDTEKIDKKLSRAGFFILLSSKPGLSCVDALRVYRERDLIEKSFNHFKNHLDFRRMRTHWNKTMEGKMFVGFIALIMQSYIRRILKNDSQTKQLTFEKVLRELRKIKAVVMSDMTELLLPLTKLQKTILSVLDIQPDILLSSS
jgi:transposase